MKRLVNMFAAGALVVSALGASVTPAGAVALPVTLGFENITANTVADANTGEAQLKVQVSCTETTVSLKFTNAGPNASSITDIYIDESALLAPGTIVDGPGVDFEWGASPGDLPGGNNAVPPFNGTRTLDADTENPTQPNGVNPGEYVTVNYMLLAPKTCADLSDDFDSGAFRIGIHVQGFTGGGSESFVNGPPPPANTAPICSVSGNVFTISDAQGLSTISGTATNVTTNPALPYTANGATSATVTASIINVYKDAALQLVVTDLGGLTANCGFTQPKTPDTGKPICMATSVRTDTDGSITNRVGGSYLLQAAYDTGSGLDRVEVKNTTFNFTSILYQPVDGTNAKVKLAVAWKTDVNMSGRFEILVYDKAGNVVTCDPIDAIVVREEGKPVTQTYTEVPHTASLLKIANGNPGLNQVVVTVNGQAFRVKSLAANEQRTLDISSALVDGDKNTVTVTGHGRKGASASVITMIGGPAGE